MTRCAFGRIVFLFTTWKNIMNMLRKFIIEQAREQWAANMRLRHAIETERDLARLAIAECDKMLFEMIPVEKPTPRGFVANEGGDWSHFDNTTTHEVFVPKG